MERLQQHAGTYLRVTDASIGTTLSIAVNDSVTAIAVLNGAPNLGLADLLNYHSLLT